MLLRCLEAHGKNTKKTREIHEEPSRKSPPRNVKSTSTYLQYYFSVTTQTAQRYRDLNKSPRYARFPRPKTAGGGVAPSMAPCTYARHPWLASAAEAVFRETPRYRPERRRHLRPRARAPSSSLRASHARFCAGPSPFFACVRAPPSPLRSRRRRRPPGSCPFCVRLEAPARVGTRAPNPSRPRTFGQTRISFWVGGRCGALRAARRSGLAFALLVRASPG